MSLSQITRESVRDAIREFDELGREPFLAKYGFRPARSYFLRHGGKIYDSKAIVGVAHGYACPEKGHLSSQDFAGGEETVAKLLRRLGFEVVETEDDVVAEAGPRYWIFQANPDVFDIDAYLDRAMTITWTVRQGRLAKKMKPGDIVFVWRASGSRKAVSGIVAMGELTGPPCHMEDDAVSRELWRDREPSQTALRVQVVIHRKCLRTKEVIRREWLRNDPVVSNLRILRFASETNYAIEASEGQRLADLVRNTGRDWNRQESIAGLWAYARTYGGTISERPGTPVAEVAIAIGRAVGGVYNKVMNFRALDPRENRKGLSSGSQVDAQVWNEFYDAISRTLKTELLEQEYRQHWVSGESIVPTQMTYAGFGNAPNDDPTELQQFAAKVRRGQPAFRENLLAAYGGRCAISGHGPEEVLEAVHIVDHAKSGINELDNGLLLRADLHSLFDTGLLHVNPESLELVVDASLKETPYAPLNGKKLRPREDGRQPNTKYLEQRWEERPA